jgi:hypothetical protein
MGVRLYMGLRIPGKAFVVMRAGEKPGGRKIDATAGEERQVQ